MYEIEHEANGSRIDLQSTCRLRPFGARASSGAR